MKYADPPTAIRMAHQYVVRKYDIPMTTFVGSGSSMSTLSNMLLNTGMTFHNRMTTHNAAPQRMTVG